MPKATKKTAQTKKGASTAASKKRVAAKTTATKKKTRATVKATDAKACVNPTTLFEVEFPTTVLFWAGVALFFLFILLIAKTVLPK